MTRHDTRTFNVPRATGTWPAARVVAARAVIADVAHHSDHLIQLACNVLVTHGESDTERRDARALLFVIDARCPVRQRHIAQADPEAGQ